MNCRTVWCLLNDRHAAIKTPVVASPRPPLAALANGVGSRPLHQPNLNWPSPVDRHTMSGVYPDATLSIYPCVLASAIGLYELIYYERSCPALTDKDRFPNMALVAVFWSHLAAMLVSARCVRESAVRGSQTLVFSSPHGGKYRPQCPLWVMGGRYARSRWTPAPISGQFHFRYPHHPPWPKDNRLWVRTGQALGAKARS